ncbi:MAG: hypothetical protein ACK4PG_06320 [Acetobacteraceae bacterium]
MHAHTAEPAEFPTTLPHGADAAPDQMAERAAWAIALATWMRTADADAAPLPAPEPALPDQAPAEWWHLMPHASDWWM